MNLPFGFEPNGGWLPLKAVLEKPVKPELLLKIMGGKLALTAPCRDLGRGLYFAQKCS